MTSLRRVPSAGYFPMLLAGLITATIDAHASGGDQVRALAVPIADLNPATPKGVVAIYNRIQRAARQMCGTDDLSGLRLLSAEWQSCVSESIAGAVRDVNVPLLSAYSAEHRRGVRVSQANGGSR
jgi:UrcA family protein